MSLSAENISQKIYDVLTVQLGLSPSDIQENSHFVDDLGADSLDIVELIMAMEEEFEVEIPDEDAEQILTVQEAIQYVTKRLS